MADPARKRATYQDVIDAPPNKLAEIVDGTLHLSPRPAPRHAAATSVLGYVLGPPFHRGWGGPGGWLILFEPELHLDDDVLVPDIAGWRRDRLAHVPEVVGITVAPDWICETLSPSTEKLDRADKLRIYARAGVAHAWLVHPLHRTLEVLRLHDGKWLAVAVYKDDQRARIEPFDAIEIDLAVLWSDQQPTRASEPTASYVPAH